MGKLKERIISLFKSHATPHGIALGVAIGVFIAILPLYGLHTILVVIFALLVPWANKIAILAGTNISLPPTLPVITWCGYNIGRLLLGGGYPPLDWQMLKNFNRHYILDFYYPLFIGSAVLGLGCAVFFYFLTLSVMKLKRRKNKANV